MAEAKKIENLVIHCTATKQSREVTRKDIEQWHLVERGWSRLGYSDMIHQDGSLENLTPFDTDDEVDYNEMTWGVKGINSISRHVVYCGGVGDDGKPLDTRTKAQINSLLIYLRYTVLRHPNIKIAGHNQFTKGKACPSFNVPKFLHDNGFNFKNIYLNTQNL